MRQAYSIWIDLGRTLNYTDHTNILYSKASQRLGLVKRSCYFITNTYKRRILYLTMVRSIFEHCPFVWRPYSESAIDKLESLQKKGH